MTDTKTAEERAQELYVGLAKLEYSQYNPKSISLIEKHLKAHAAEARREAFDAVDNLEYDLRLNSAGVRQACLDAIEQLGDSDHE